MIWAIEDHHNQIFVGSWPLDPSEIGAYGCSSRSHFIHLAPPWMSTKHKTWAAINTTKYAAAEYSYKSMYS